MRVTLYFLVAAASFFWPVLTAVRPKKRLLPAQKIMMAEMTCTGVVFCLLGCFSIPSLYGNVWVELAFSTFLPFMGVFYFLFIRSLTDKEGVRVKDLAILIPVMLLIVSGYAFDIFSGKEAWSQYVAAVFNGGYAERGDLSPAVRARILGGFWVQRLFVLVEFLLVLFYGQRQLRIYSHDLEDYYSELHGLADSMNTYTSAYTWMAAIVVTTFTLSDNILGGRLSPLTVIAALLAIVAVVSIGSYAHSLEQSAKDIADMAEEDAKRQAAEVVPQVTVTESPIERYAKALREAVAEKVYLEPGLELTDLADRIGTNRTYLSNIIHDEYGQNFSEFVNSRRISYAIKMMTESEEQFPVRYVAMKCGYNSLQSFYNNFAKYTGGKTPASFLKK